MKIENLTFPASLVEYVEKTVGHEVEDVKLLAEGWFNCTDDFDCVILPPDNTKEESAAALACMGKAVYNINAQMEHMIGKKPILIGCTEDEIVACIDNSFGVFVAILNEEDDDA